MQRRMPCKCRGRNWVMCLQLKEHRRWPANHQKRGERYGTDPLSQAPEGINVAKPWPQTPSFLQPWDNMFLLCKPLSCDHLFWQSEWRNAVFSLVFSLDTSVLRGLPREYSSETTSWASCPISTPSWAFIFPSLRWRGGTGPCQLCSAFPCRIANPSVFLLLSDLAT